MEKASALTTVHEPFPVALLQHRTGGVLPAVLTREHWDIRKLLPVTRLRIIFKSVCLLVRRLQRLRPGEYRRRISS